MRGFDKEGSARRSPSSPARTSEEKPPLGAPIRYLGSHGNRRRADTRTVQELLQSFTAKLPRRGRGGASEDVNFQGGFKRRLQQHGRDSGVNLRGLGNTATLVLVNGHRVASSNSGFFTEHFNDSHFGHRSYRYLDRWRISHLRI